jgi:hypothetical protein
MQDIRSLVLAAGVVMGLTSATAAHAQVVSGAVGGATEEAPSVGAAVGVQAHAAAPAAHTAREMIAMHTAAMLEGITLTAYQRTAIDAYGKMHAARVQELGGMAVMHASAKPGPVADSTVADSTSADSTAAGAHARAVAQDPAAMAEAEARASARREQMQAAAAEYRARVRGVLTAKQQARFDANVQAAAQGHGAMHH